MIPLDEKTFYQEVGERFKQFREILGLSPQQLAAVLDAAAPAIERIESGVINNQLLFLFIYGLSRDYGLSINWLIFGVGQAFACRGPKTPPEIYEGYIKGFYAVDDEQLLTDLVYLLRIPEAKQVINGQVIILKIALKKELEALKSSQTPGNNNTAKETSEGK